MFGAGVVEQWNCDHSNTLFSVSQLRLPLEGVVAVPVDVEAEDAAVTNNNAEVAEEPSLRDRFTKTFKNKHYYKILVMVLS